MGERRNVSLSWSGSPNAMSWAVKKPADDTGSKSGLTSVMRCASHE